MSARRFAIRTFGCQMNVHDSDKLANLLLHAGYAAGEPESADVLIVNTCSIREKAEHKLYSDLGALRGWKAERPGRLIGVGGCVAQQEGDALLARFPQVDFVFGTHNLRLVPALALAAEEGRRSADVSTSASLDRFDLPERHPGFAETTPGRAFLTVMEGCDMFCSFCIVPTTRGREISRPAVAIVREAEELAARGVVELVLLGQTVNAYGRHDLRRGRAEEAGTIDFGSLVERLAGIPGIRRIRYTSPHPIFFDEALVHAHGAIEALCPHVHLPVQSGSDAVLGRMRRRYRADEIRALADRLRAARGDLVLTTDLIVGFPGESDADFEATLALVRDVGFVDGFSFKYSPRPGTAAAEMGDSVPAGVAQERLEVLQAQLRAQTLAYHRSRVGGLAEVLVEGRGRRVRQLTGRDAWHRLVHLDAGEFPDAAPGLLVGVRVAEATPHSLLGEPPAARSGSPDPPVVPIAGLRSGAAAIRR
jgi:tRNA-2-methylthio-N6-dimethylallyladenosine synthase